MKINIANAGKIFKRLRLDFIGFTIASILKKSEKPIRIPNSIDKLRLIHSDDGKSSITENEIDTDPQYDIQVIMPVYNTEKMLKQAIESVLNQEGNLRILLVIINDGSPDKSSEILTEYECRPNVHIINQNNKGFSGARNSGLRKIQAKYITFVDSDDYLSPNALRALFKSAETYNSEIVQGSYSLFTDGAKTKYIKFPNLSKDAKLTGYPWGKLFKSHLFQRICFPEGYWFEDTIMSWLLYPLTPDSKKTSISDIVYNYRINPNGITMTAQHNKKVIDTIWVCLKIFSDRENIGLPLEPKEYEKFLRQALLNVQRIYQYGDIETTKIAFSAMNEIRLLFFKQMPAPKNKLRYLHNTLESNCFRSFLFAGGLI